MEYRYDAFGRRIIRKEGSTKTALLWWGNSECTEQCRGTRGILDVGAAVARRVKTRVESFHQYKHHAGQAAIQNDIFSHPNGCVPSPEDYKGERQSSKRLKHKHKSLNDIQKATLKKETNLVTLGYIGAVDTKNFEYSVHQYGGRKPHSTIVKDGSLPIPVPSLW